MYRLVYISDSYLVLLVGILVGMRFRMRLMQGRGREAKVQGFDCGAFRGVSHALEWGN